MYFSSTQISFMGTSYSEFSLSKEDQKESISHIQSSPTLDSSIGSQNPPSNHQNKQVNHTEESISPVFLETESQLLADDNDGFRTPISLDHKIPVTKQCPPAPRKNRATHFSSRKRKLDSSLVFRNLQLDLTDEIESMFPPSVKENLGRRIKKARRDED